MRSHVAALAHFAVIEIAKHCFPLDEDARVTGLPVPALQQPSQARFEPVASSGMGIARRVACLGEGRRRRIDRYRKELAKVGARFGVLDVVADQNYGKLALSCIDGKT